MTSPSEPVRVLALDPGERVGWARAVVLPDGSWSDVRHGITPLRDMAVAVAQRAADYDVIVCEDWRLYPHMAQQFVGSSFPSVKFIGAVQLAVWLNPPLKLVMQGARIKKVADQTMRSARPELLAKVTRPGAHDDQHDLDALRHLWYWTFKKYPIHTQEEAA